MNSAPENPHDVPHGPGSWLKVICARHIGFAMIHYAANHHDHFPETFEDAIPFLHDELTPEIRASVIENASRYEILFHGTRQELNRLPPTTIIVREKGPWLDQHQRTCRAVCFADSSAAIWVDDCGRELVLP